jgi:preprotein translocase subunit SecD
MDHDHADMLVEREQAVHVAGQEPGALGAARCVRNDFEIRVEPDGRELSLRSHQCLLEQRGSAVQSANDLAISLASGKLPVKLNVIEERTVGPDLGKDSIQKGIIASVAATLAVIVFMLVTYGRFGVYTTYGLIVNALLILGIMAIFNASLTLPGIAGFVLTIGAAVDANVLINERIREEQRRGRKILDSIETGYKEASTAIFDANITNVIAAGLMWYFGSGPIRGFAVVLMIGIVTSVFTAVNFTRMLVSLWVRRKRPRALHI